LARGIHNERYKELIEALAAARRNAGMTQTDLAKRFGRLQQFVSKYESGERRLDVVEFADIAHALGLDLTRLVGEIPTR
jgi:transcriptional regulator with XRE-family HTH domain